MTTCAGWTRPRPSVRRRGTATRTCPACTAEEGPPCPHPSRARGGTLQGGRSSASPGRRALEGGRPLGREDGTRARHSRHGVRPVTLPLVIAVTVAAGLLALAGVASTLARRRIGLLHLWGAVLLEVLLLVQAALAVVALLRGDRLADTPTFLSYLVGLVLLPIAGALWARTEPSRWAGTVLAVAAAAVGVMIWRLQELWEATGG